MSRMKSTVSLKLSLSILLGLLTTAATHFNSHAVAGVTDVFESGRPLPYSFVGWLSGRSWDWRAAGVDIAFWAVVWFVVLWTIACVRRRQALPVVLLLLLTACQAIPQTRAQPTATPEPLLSQVEAGTRMIEHLRQLGLREGVRIFEARQLSLRDAVREVAGDSRLERGLVEAGVGQPGKEPDKPVWFFNVQTANRHYPYLLYFMDARTGEVMDWPTPPEALTPPPPGAPMPPRPTDPPQPTLTEEERRARDVAASATREARFKRGEVFPIPVGTPERMGYVITVAGQPVQLPPNAWVYDLNLSDGTYIIVTRGNSRTMVHGLTGVMMWEKITPGEEGTFDFLRPYVVTPMPPR